MKQSSRLDNLGPYPFARWGELVDACRRRDVDLIRLDIGNPDMGPPVDVVETLCRSARRVGHHGYPEYRGTPALRQAIARYYERRFGVGVDVEREVLALIGSKEGLINLSLAALQPGDVALIPDPGYTPYARGALLAGAEAYRFPLRPDLGFLPDLEAIPAEIASSAVLMWLNYPNNPTGATASLDFFSRAVGFARRHGLLLCHDTPYSDVTDDGYRAPSMLEVPGAREVAVEFNSLSKMCNMAGWRIGMAVGNADAITGLSKVKSNVDSGIFLPLQEAAIEALNIDDAWLYERNATYRHRLDLLVDGFRQMGLEATRPEATFYLWIRITGLSPGGASSVWTSECFARMLLEETGIVVAPGSFFGTTGEGFIRVSATAPTAQIEEAVERLRAFQIPASALERSLVSVDCEESGEK